jgi:A/G-specific adenine glycosylase
MRRKRSSTASERAAGLDAEAFRTRLARWYRENARVLPWRGVDDAYATWLSEVMLQQTRVSTVVERYKEFLQRFPTVQALAQAEEAEVLALWSGLGYYRRARMLHKGAQFVVRELCGVIPQTRDGLLALPGVGAYTAAAIASIAFGEGVAVLDGNVERVLLRVLGEPERKTAASKTRLTQVAQSLMPPRPGPAAGDHNQAMMELGATVCLPRGPLCLHCPVVALCRTRGEHATAERAAMKRRKVAHLLLTRKRAGKAQVLLQRRPAQASLMPGMLELPPLPLEAVQAMEPLLQVKHAITDTNYTVEVFEAADLRKQIVAAKTALQWVAVERLREVPLTGLARKVLLRTGIMPKGTLPKAAAPVLEQNQVQR